MKISIIKNNFVNKDKTFSYSKGKDGEGTFVSLKTIGFVFDEGECFEVDLKSLKGEVNDFGVTYTINNATKIKRIDVFEDFNSGGERVVVKSKTIKSYAFPNMKDYSPEDGINTVWGYWTDTEGMKYTGVVNPEKFKKNAVFSVEGTKSKSKWGDEIKVNSIELREFDTNRPEFLLRSMGFNSVSIVWALDNNIFEDTKDEEIKVSNIKNKILDAKKSKALTGIGPKSLDKILKNIRVVRKEMASPSSIDSTTKFKNGLQDLLIEHRVQAFWNNTEAGRTRYLSEVHKGFVDILEGSEAKDFEDKYGVSKIDEIVDLIKRNPYVLILLPRKGFKTVDVLARQLGFDVASIDRQEACVNGILDGEIKSGFGGNGDIYLDREALFKELVDELSIDEDGFEEEFTKIDSDKLFLKLRNDGNTNFYHWMNIDEDGQLTEKFTNKKNFSNEELIFDKIKQGIENTAWRRPIISPSKLTEWISNFEKKEGEILGINYKLSEEQEEAIKTINDNRQSIFCMTGFAGTGKSTVSKAILELLEIDYKGRDGLECLAVSGMASRRINEATGFKSTTITSYLYNPRRIKKTKVLFIDEASMVDSETMATLLKRINMVEVKVIFVGDVGQLPPIGRGTPFKDILESGWVNNVKLEKIFRQDESAVLTTFAKNMREETVEEYMIEDSFSDFDFLKVEDRMLYKIRKELRFFEEIEEPSNEQKFQMRQKRIELNKALSLCNINIKNEVQSLIIKYKNEFKKDYNNFQLISPQKSGIVGTEAINLLAQDILNDAEIPFLDDNIKVGNVKHYKRLKIGDKVIHTKNENWFLGENLGFFYKGRYIKSGIEVNTLKESYCHPVGGRHSIRILNGMVGIIDNYDNISNIIRVKYRYEDVEIGVEYKFKDLGSLHLGYCLTIHKLQGSEAKTVGLIVSPSHVIMINNNLLYTGITRGKTKGYIVGSKNAFKQGLKKHGTIRQTMLPLLFKGLFWDLEDLAKKEIILKNDTWTHDPKENFVICSDKNGFDKFVQLNNSYYQDENPDKHF